MNISLILIPALLLAALGAFFGAALALAAHAFAVRTDPRVPKVREILPGANCGGCGYSGCDALAAAIVEGKAPCGACTVGGNEVAQKIGAVMGVTVAEKKRMRAMVFCSGGDLANKKYIYEGAGDCIAAEKLAGGDKLCANGCIGLGSCAAACPFHAIRVIGGAAVVDDRLCAGCGQCVDACPKKIIRLIPFDSAFFVGCASVQKGAAVVRECRAGCIGCMLCQRVCESGAIRVVNNLAEIDYDKCTGCGKCAAACRRHIIRPVLPKRTQSGQEGKTP